MVEAKAAVLAVEAGQALLFDKDYVIHAADEYGLTVLGVQENDNGELLFKD
jgi:DUF1009 family protein